MSEHANTPADESEREQGYAIARAMHGAATACGNARRHSWDALTDEQRVFFFERARALINALRANSKPADTPEPDESERLHKKGIYVASRSRHAHIWLDLRDKGFPIISTWINEAGVGETVDWADLWHRCTDEAKSASGLLLYASDDDEALNGAFVEVGAALANRVPIAVVAPDSALRNLIHDPRLVRFESIERALAYLSSVAAVAPPALPANEAGAGEPSDDVLIGAVIDAAWRMPAVLDPHVGFLVRKSRDALLARFAALRAELERARAENNRFRKTLKKIAARATADYKRRGLHYNFEKIANMARALRAEEEK